MLDLDVGVIDDMLAVENTRQATSGLECVALKKVDGSNLAFENSGKSVKSHLRSKFSESRF